MSEPMWKAIHEHIMSGKHTKRAIDGYNTKENEWVFDAEGLAFLKAAILQDIRTDISHLAKLGNSGMRVVNLAEIESLTGGQIIACEKFAKDQ